MQTTKAFKPVTGIEPIIKPYATKHAQPIELTTRSLITSFNKKELATKTIAT